MRSYRGKDYLALTRLGIGLQAGRRYPDEVGILLYVGQDGKPVGGERSLGKVTVPVLEATEHQGLHTWVQKIQRRAGSGRIVGVAVFCIRPDS